jgi:hypothetical protein
MTLENVKASLRAVEDRLGVLHEQAAVLRDVAPSGSTKKAAARKVAHRVERALQQLEAIHD